jgi:DUF971 family protein
MMNAVSQCRTISTREHIPSSSSSSTGASSSPTLGVIPKPPSPATLRSVVTKKLEKQRADEASLAERLALHQTVFPAAAGGGAGEVDVRGSPTARGVGGEEAAAAPTQGTPRARADPLPSTIFRRDAVPDEIRILRDRTVLRLRWSTEDGEVEAHPAEAALRQVMPESTSTVLGTIAGPTANGTPAPNGTPAAGGNTGNESGSPLGSSARTPPTAEAGPPSSSSPQPPQEGAVKLAKPEPHTQATPKPIVLQYQFQAEFLRARAPSTDVLGSPNVLIYGKRGLYIKELYPVGSYAIRIIFSDGHDAGIFPYAFLRELGETKFANYRLYIKQLREARKIRDAPVKRAKSSLPRPLSAQAATSNSGGCGANRTH